MVVTYLDLKTGRRASEKGVSEFNLTENNWLCDCNRRSAFEDLSDSGACDGCKRFIVIQVTAEDGEEFDEIEVIKRANEGYISLS